MMSPEEKYIAWRQYDAMYNRKVGIRSVYLCGGLDLCSLIKARAEVAERKYLGPNPETGYFHSQLATSFLQAESAMISFANALASVKSKCANEPVDILKWDRDVKESEMNGALVSLQFKHFCDGSKIYGCPPAYLALPWLRIAEELPNWRKELAKKAFNVKYHG